MFKQPWNLVGNGLMTYNGVLVGTVTASLCPAIVEATHGPLYLSWFLITFGGVMRYFSMNDSCWFTSCNSKGLAQRSSHVRLGQLVQRCLFACNDCAFQPDRPVDLRLPSVGHEAPGEHT